MKIPRSLTALAFVSALSLSVLATGSANAEKIVFVAVEGGAEAEPTTAHTTVTTAPVGAEHIILIAPPAPKVETRPPPPSNKEYVWIAGHWKWEPAAKAHAWVPGHWEKHKIGHTWVHAHWVVYGGKYHFIPGYWRAWGVSGGADPEPTAPHIVGTTAPVGAEYVIVVAPPAPKVEVKPPPPSMEYVWVSGHWKWEPAAKAHAWVPGHWEKHKVGHVWVHSHWIFYGGKYHFMNGYWRKA